MTKATVYAKNNSALISPKKVRPVIDLIRGKTLTEAKLILAFDTTKAAKVIFKTVKSAEANAKNNLNLDAKKLFIHEVYADEGRVLRKGRFVGRGRFNPILKRTSRITVGLSEKSGGGAKK